MKTLYWIGEFLFLLQFSLSSVQTCTKYKAIIVNRVSWCCGELPYLGEKNESKPHKNETVTKSMVGADEEIKILEDVGDEAPLDSEAESPKEEDYDYEVKHKSDMKQEISGLKKSISPAPIPPPFGASTTAFTPLQKPIIPTGDCICGQRQNKTLVADKMSSPYTWLARIRIGSSGLEEHICTGALLNRKWLISAAHCFCILDSIPCHGGENVISAVETLKSIKVKAVDETWAIEKLIIHPDFKYIKISGKIGHPDIALLKTMEHMFNQDGVRPLIQPICLPKLEDIEVRDVNGVKSMAPAPFMEDLDCVWIPKVHMNKYPYSSEAEETAKLVCHPGEKPFDKRSHITAFEQESLSQSLCKTNSYGPVIWTPCKNECAFYANPSMLNKVCQKVKEDGLFDTTPETNSFQLNAQGQWINEDVAWIRVETPENNITCYPDNPEIKTFEEYPYQNGWCKTETKGDGEWGWCSSECNSNIQPQGPDISHEAIVDSFLYNTCADDIDTKTEFCSSLPLITAYGKVYAQDASQMLRLKNHQLRKSIYTLKEKSAIPSDLNTTATIRRRREAELTAASGEENESDGGAGFYFDQNFESVSYLQAAVNVLSSIMCCDKCRKVASDTKLFNYDKTKRTCYCMKIKRGASMPPTKKGHNQHSGVCPETMNDLGQISLGQSRMETTNEANMCFGSAGGAVWKYINYEVRNGGVSYMLATLTGIISRFESGCGAFSMRSVNSVDGTKRQQNIVSTRIQKLLNWIHKTIDDEDSKCGMVKPGEALFPPGK